MFWAILACGFLWRYEALSGISTNVLLEHFRIYGVSVLALILARLLVAAIPSSGFRRWGQAALTMGFLTLWLAFYVLVLAGLQYWGEVITLDILRVYLRQSETLMSTLGVSPLVLILLFGISAALCFKGLIAFHKCHWTRSSIEQIGWRRLGILAVGLIGIVLIESLTLNFRLELSTHEPLALVLKERKKQTEQVLGVDGKSGRSIRQAAVEARQSYVPAVNPLKANVILIIVDALRDDHLSLNGYARQTTPKLQNWLERTGGISLGKARSACASSVCGITSIISSMFAHEQTMEAMTLHEVLAKNGWKSYLALSGDHTNFYGLRQRYGQVDSYIDGSQVEPAMLNDDRFVLDAVKGYRAQGPSFIHLHLKSSHILGRRFLPSGSFGESANYSNPLFRMNADYVQRSINYYDEGVLQADYVIDQALSEMQSNGLLNRALVLITGDHGEHLGEHGQFSHAHGVLEPVVRVPWIMLPFGMDLSSMEARGRLHQVDMAPTLLDLMHIPAPSGWSGVSLLQKKRHPDFSYLRQGSVVGLVDHRDPAAEYKYTTEPPPAVERVVNLSMDPMETSDNVVNDKLLQEWRSLLLPQLLNLVRNQQ